jgi:glycosyltransferase involved in cell wall biosynthesis
LPYIVIENAVDVNLFFPENNNNKIFEIVHISTMGYQKNTNSLLSAIEKVFAESDLEWKLTLIGPYNQQILEQVENSATLGVHTTITGNIPYIEVAKHLRQANLMVLFSRYENLPCVILEALCAGIPVISTNVGGISEVVNKINGLLIENEDMHALQNALQFMLNNFASYNNNDISKDAINMYSYEAIGKKFQNAYKEILK